MDLATHSTDLGLKFWFSVAGHDDPVRWQYVAPISGQVFQEFKAGHFRHVLVNKDNVGAGAGNLAVMPLAGRAEGGVVENPDFMPQLCEVDRQRFPDALFIIDNKYTQFSWRQ